MKLFSVFAVFRDFFCAFFEKLSKKELPILSIEADDSEGNENENYRVGKDRGGSTEDVIDQPKSSITEGANSCYGRTLLHDADCKEPNCGASDEIVRRGHHYNRNDGKADDEHAGEPHREGLSVLIKEEAHDSLHDGKNNHAAYGNAVLENVLHREN